ncbi:sensor histidine kinase [Paenibacillus tarimensis]|uniref:sensor histidine kinase n=1 Tax=Paenibacillus tarimensis TaxID=416012 RepID=UPI001F29B155|nr:GAF domain-containing sensor histidine kinase [Paenibacillus tarimensis]MCF2944344.1 GAF domain-containing sensor histidine kinase [Paenibacillus tarimensis]
MQEDVKLHEAELLREIAETINGTYDMTQMLDLVLAKLLELTGLQTGWVFLLRNQTAMSFSCAADACLPPALTVNDKEPLREGDCWCIDRFKDGRLKRAVNILNCKRIEDAILLKRGDTGNLTHHATIPLRSGDKLFGILNVASPGKTVFSEEELALLQSVSYQVGTAAHRIQLFGQERKRAALFEKLGTATRELRAITEPERIAAEIVRIAGTTFGWSNAALWMRENQGLFLHASYEEGEVTIPATGSPKHSCELLEMVLNQQEPLNLQEPVEPQLLPSSKPVRSAAVVPLLLQGKPIGALAAGHASDEPFDAADTEVLAALSAHAAQTYDSARLQEQGRALARWEERNRIARDLHDSVSQMLFSLQLHARGLENVLQESPEGTRQAVREVGRLSREALAEMRAMIRQLRPPGLEEGLLTGLSRYGTSIGLQISCSASSQLAHMPESTEVTLWRIGQEALNNVSKHAGVDRASISLVIDSASVVMTVSDDGAGIESGAGSPGFGLSIMRERAEAAGGTVTWISSPREGTSVLVRLPLTEQIRQGGNL